VTPERDEFQVVMRIAHRAGLGSRLLVQCVERRLLPSRGPDWDREAYAVACRVRRLTSLGVNMQGVEMVLHMRRRILEMQRELAALRAEMEDLHCAQEREIARLMRQLADEPEP